LNSTLRVALALVSLGFGGSALAQDERPSAQAGVVEPVPPAAPATDSRQLEASDLDAWLSGFINASIEQAEIAGAVVSVVKDGELLLSAGYGFADVSSEKPMDPARTLVRVGSTAKLFTWTAVMQLVEQGKLELDEDVNTYLDFTIPERPDGPVTMRDLMNHRGGFEEGLREILFSDPEQFISTEEYLKAHPRPRIFPAGSVPAYSNYGTALAGYIVERLSGEAFEDYVAHYILGPLGMEHATFHQPLPDAWSENVSAGYIRGDQSPWAFELVAAAPAGALSATAEDMARFMIAHLQDGRLRSARILEPGTARLMYSPSVSLPEGFATMAHGFFRSTDNGRLVIGHGGDTILFHTDLNLLPEEGVGIFVSFNSRGAQNAVYSIRQRLFENFMDRYFPAVGPKTDPPSIEGAREHAEALAGKYESSRRIETAFLRVFYLLQQSEVIANEDGTISLGSNSDKRYREVGPGIWRDVSGDDALAVTKVGERVTILSSANPVSVLQAVPARRNSSLNVTILLGSAIALAAVLAAWPVGWFYRRKHRQPLPLKGEALRAHRVVRLAAIGDFAYLFGWSLALQPLIQNRLDAYGPSLDALLVTLQVGTVVPIAGALSGLWNVWITLRSERHWTAKIGSLLLAAALLGVVWIAWNGGLMQFNLEY